MDIEKELMEKLKRFEDIKNQITEMQKKIGGLQEQQRATYNKGLELKGQIDLLLQLKDQEKEALGKSATAKLTLPDGVKPIINVSPAQESTEVSSIPEFPVSSPSEVA